MIGSINGTSPSAWLAFAQQIEQAGADALELNMYNVVTEADQSALVVENGLRQVVRDLKHELKIPVAVKVSPFFTAFSHVAREFDRAGADGLVLFNRFLQPDIDIEHLTVWPRLSLSGSDELLLRLQWLAILHGRLKYVPWQSPAVSRHPTTASRQFSRERMPCKWCPRSCGTGRPISR